MAADWIFDARNLAFGMTLVVLGAGVFFSRSMVNRLRRGRRLAGKPQSLSENNWQTIQILDSLYGFVGICDLDGNLIFASRAPLKALGLEEKKILGKPFWKNHAWDYSKDVQDELRDSIHRARRGENVRYVVDNRAANGAYITLDMTITPLRETNGEITKILAFATDITSQVAAEKAREENEKLLSEITQTTPVPVIFSDYETGEFRFYNAAAELLCREKLGFELSGRRTLDIWWSPEDRKEYVAAIGKTNKLSACPVAVKTLAGEKYWLEAYATTIDVLGRKSILSCLVDANDRYQAEQALRHAKKTFDRAQRIAEMGSWEWNIVSNEVSWSDQIYRMFGYPVGAVSPTFSMFMAHVHEDDRELVETAIKNALDNFAPYDINHRIVLADGRIKILHEQGEIECNDHGEPVRMLGAVQDITALCQTEEALRRSQLTLSGILNISPEAMIVTNEEGRITIFSAGAEAIFGYASEEMVGRRVEWLMPERFRMRHRDLIGEFDASRTVSKQMGERQEIVGLRKNGEEFPAKASLSKLITPDGTYFTTILRDVTAEKRHEADLTDARKRAESASEAKSAFLATMSHELRTPLNGVLGAAQILRNQNLDETALEWVNMINDSGENLLVLLNDILDICRIEEGKLSIAEEEFDILQLFDSVIAPRRLIAGEKAVELTLEMSFRNTYYKGDPKRIRQILTNLINNAIKFTDRGEIRVAAKVEVNDGAAVLCCSVTDTGCGIPKEFQAKIFERFAQVEDGRTRTHDGVGLGLAICNELVRAMGGTISLESEPGRGSLFSFRIPLQFVDEEHQSPDAPEGIWPAASARMSDKKPVALIVDDQAINRTVISTFVRTFGVEALEASSGAEALELCKTTGFDIILMDIHMPGMCGQETLARLRAGDSPNKSTPIIAVTADAMLGDRQKYLDNGFEAYLSKPVKAPELKRALSEFIDLNIIEPSNRVSEVRPTKSASG